MSPGWSKQGLFKVWVAEAKEKLGATNNADVAKVMGLEPTSLKKYLSALNTKRPGRAALKALGDFLGRDYRELMEDPLTGAPEGVDAGAWAAADEETRVFATTMFHLTKDFTPEQRQALLAMVKAGRAMGAKRKGKG